MTGQLMESRGLIPWIKENIRPRKSPNPNKTTRDIKVAYEQKTGCLVTYDDVEQAMVHCGYSPMNPTKKYKFYRISDASPAFHKGGHDHERRMD